MSIIKETPRGLQAENEELRRRLEEAENLVQAIQSGEVDAFLMKQGVAERVFTLETADRPYHILLEKMEQGAVVLTSADTIAYCNECFARLLQTPVEPLIGAAFASFVPVANRSTFEVLLTQARSTSVQGEITLQRADGTTFPAYLTLNPLQEPTPGVSLIVTDLTEQKRHAELLASHELAPLIFEQAIDGIVVCDAAGKVVRASAAARELSGVNPLLQPFDSVFAIFYAPPDDHGELGQAAPERAVSTAAILQGQTTRGLEAVLVRDDGAQVPLLVNAGPLRNDQQEVLGCIITLTDITQRKRSEEMLKTADRRKDEFLAILGHELRNPLAPIRSAVAIMRLCTIDDPALARARDIIERQSLQMIHLVDDLLDVSRISRGKIRLRKERVALAEVIERAVETSRPLVEARRQKLAISVPAEPVHLHIDAARMSQVVANLLNNAAKYSEPQGRIELSALKKDNEVVIRVRDAGVGIKPEVLPHIFNLFTQSERNLDRSEGGLGIGLALVRSFVELHGGKVSASSAGPGKGSEFVVTLPLAETAEVAPSRPSEFAPTRPTITPLRILVVDDNLDAADSLALLLRLDGHQVETADSGPKALVAAEWSKPQVVVLDIGLPQMDGFQVARRLRQLPGVDKALLIALTGYGGENRQRCQQAGFDHHLTKPVDLPALEALLAAFTVRKLSGGKP